jgi:ribosomal protein S18 acetylase RimI-like enzyme
MIKVRAATAADMDIVGRFGALLVSFHHDLDPTRFFRASDKTPAMYARYLSDQITRPEAIILVAEGDGAVVGYVWAGIEGPDYMALRGPAAAIYDLYVDPDHRRQGIGGALLDTMLAAIRERADRQVVLSTAFRNEEAQRLFASKGFRATMVEMTRDA